MRGKYVVFFLQVQNSALFPLLPKSLTRKCVYVDKFSKTKGKTTVLQQFSHYLHLVKFSNLIINDLQGGAHCAHL